MLGGRKAVGKDTRHRSSQPPGLSKCNLSQGREEEETGDTEKGQVWGTSVLGERQGTGSHLSRS